jgi:hypothetical protein
MALRISTGLRNALVGTGGFKELMDNGFLDIYSGSQPASADAIESGVKLARITSTSGTAVSDGLKFGTASLGILPITTPTWNGVVLVAGVAGWARFYASAGTSGSSSTAYRFDVSCGISGTDVILSHTSLTLDSILTVKTFNVEQPAE